MIGDSLPFAYCLRGSALFGEKKALYGDLRRAGVDSVELRTVRHGSTPAEVLAAATELWDNGFAVTVHGEVCSSETAVPDVFVPLETLLHGAQQKSLTVTIHPIVGDNAVVLTALADYAQAHGYPVRIALENNFRQPRDSPYSVSLKSVPNTGRSVSHNAARFAAPK